MHPAFARARGGQTYPQGGTVRLASLEAQFGAALHGRGVVGAVHALRGADEYACAPLPPAANDSVAIIRRGPPDDPCPFDTKVSYCKQTKSGRDQG